MEEKNSEVVDKNDEVKLPGFRFHPTDEELVGFYLKRKIQQRTLPIELIKQVDIYKYDPWDLPKLASTGEKELYFYCPRDRKYRNSIRPNRVTGAGFWKATGTDRPIYSSDATKCIGLKKSLVFYRGRAAKAIKTDWMMHEFRLPSLGEPSPPKKLLDKSLPSNDAWAICRIFKKINSMAQRALCQSWASPQLVPADTTSPANIFFDEPNCCSPQLSPENISCTTEIGSLSRFCSSNDSSYLASEAPSSYKPMNPSLVYNRPSIPVSNGDITPTNFTFSPLEQPILSLNFEGSQQQQPLGEFSISSNHQDMEGNVDIWPVGFPFNLQGDMSEVCKSANNMPCD